MTLERFRHTEPESEAQHLEILQLDLETEENHPTDYKQTEMLLLKFKDLCLLGFCYVLLLGPINFLLTLF